MKHIGCLTVIVLIIVALAIWASTKDMTEEQRARWVGEKAHRGWNKARELAQHTQEGWKQAPGEGTTKKAPP